jgi:hypothetical protein
MVVHYFKHKLDYCRERARRADEHVADLEREIVLVFERQANAALIRLDPKPPHRVIADLPGETFAGLRLGTLIGETCYNLRCVLDYLVYALAELDFGTPQKRTQFPIMDTAQDFAGNGTTMLVGVNTAHVAAIEKLQPYMGCDWTRRLRDISNMDKHRHIVPSGGNTQITAHSSLEKDISKITGVKRKTLHPITRKEVDVKVHAAGQITFPDGTSVIEITKQIKAGVADALRRFEPDFK